MEQQFRLKQHYSALQILYIGVPVELQGYGSWFEYLSACYHSISGIIHFLIVNWWTTIKMLHSTIDSRVKGLEMAGFYTN